MREFDTPDFPDESPPMLTTKTTPVCVRRRRSGLQL